jgi:hypothetical protein
MAVGKRRRARQLDLFVPVGALAEKPASPFYDRLNRLLEAIGFDALCESAFAPYYDPDTSKGGRPALAPGNFMRLLIVGFFEGLDSDRGIAWIGSPFPTDNPGILCSAIDSMIPNAAIAIISSTIDIPRRSVVDLSLTMFSSSSILMVMTVLVIDMANARNIESTNDRCNA